MEKQISKILTLTFALAGTISGLTLGLLLKALAGAFGFLAVLMGHDLFRHGLPLTFGFLVFVLLQFNPRALGWGYEVIVELKRVVWPSQKDVVTMTWAVFIMVTVISLVIALFDFVSSYILRFLIG
jgi:preprotein translocase subunit SecE